jgi:hypothetical protein
LQPSLPKKTDPAKLPSPARRNLTPGLRCQIGNRPILASRAEYFNKKNALHKGPRKKNLEPRASILDPGFHPRTSHLSAGRRILRRPTDDSTIRSISMQN